MSISEQAATNHVKDLSAVPEEIETFARIEGLVGEEAALLSIPRRTRNRAQRERLKAISAELNRIWSRLRERAESLHLDGHSSTTSQ
jgi:hypothetical protein